MDASITKIITIVLLVIVSIILIVIGFAIAYRLYLNKWLGTWLDPIICKIPFIGNLVTGNKCNSGFSLGISDSISLARPDLYSETPKIGVNEGVRNFGHGVACSWRKDNCNIWDTKLKKFEAPGQYTEQQRKLFEDEEEQADKWQKLWQPMQRKQFSSVFGDKGSLVDIQKNQKNVKERVDQLFAKKP